MFNKFRKPIGFFVILLMVISVNTGAYAAALQMPGVSSGATTTDVIENTDSTTTPDNSGDSVLDDTKVKEGGKSVDDEALKASEEAAKAKEAAEAAKAKEAAEAAKAKEAAEAAKAKEAAEMAKAKEAAEAAKAKEAAKAEDADQEEEVPIIEESPAAKLTADVEGIHITVSADAGVLPRDTTLAVESISKEDSQHYADSVRDNEGISLEEFLVFDITLLDANGDEIQPDGEVTVDFSGIEFADKAESVVAYHLGEKDKARKGFGVMQFFENISKGKATIDKMSTKTKNGKVSFETDHFSIYLVGTVPTATYNFYVSGTAVDTQIVLDGEKLEEPETPAKQDGKKFTGWEISSEATFIDFSQPITVTSPSSIINVNAVFEDVYYVYFIYDDKVVKTKEVIPSETTNDNDIPLVILEDGKALSHWSTTEGGSEFNFTTLIAEDTTLYAVLADMWRVTFDTQGGSSLLPKYAEDGHTLGIVDTPVRAGYDFLRWNTNADGTGTDYINTTAINGSVTLYAIWGAKTVNYSIIYWQENADDTDYTYKETVSAQGMTGTIVTLAGNSISNTRYPYFSYKEYDTGKIIKGDGTTVINVRYSRNEYKVEFNLNRVNTKLKIGTPEVTYTYPTKYSFTAKYESNISNLWPTATNIPNDGSYKFYGWSANSYGTGTLNVSKRLNLTSDLISTTGTKTSYGVWSSTLSEYTLHYMIESLTSSGEKLHNGKWYNEDPAYSQVANSQGSWNAKQLPGVTKVGDPKTESGNNVYFFYDRNSYDLNFYNPTIFDEKVTRKYGASIAGEYYEPNRPVGVNEDYVFTGWYTNPDGVGSPFVFTNEKMPENNLALYSKWAPPVFRVGFYETQDGEGELQRTVEIPAGGTISEANLTKDIPDGVDEDTDFAGWYWYLDGIFVPYDFSTPVIHNNYVLYPVWKDTLYKVTYASGGAIVTVPVDNNKYILGAAANVKSPTYLTPPTDKVFLGWKNLANPQSEIYHLNDKLVITGNMTLTAQWGDIVADTTLTYKANGGTGVDVVYTLKNNDIHKVKDNTFTKEGYEFIGWYTKAYTGETDITEDLFQPGAEIVVGNKAPAPNELYAIWAKKITVTAASDSKVYNGFPLTNNTATAIELLPGHTMSEVTVTGSQTLVGSSANVPSAAKITGLLGIDVTWLYDITYVNGTLEVTKNNLTVTANSGTEVYDGTEKTVTGYTVTSGLLSGHILSGITASGSGVNVGNYPVTFDGTPIVMDGTVDVTGNYTVTVIDGWLEITPAQLTVEVTGNSDTKEYTGSEQTVTGYQTPVGLLAGHTLEGITASGSGTNVGNYPVTFTGTPVIMDGTVDVTENYAVTLVPGNLEITKASIAVTVTAVDASKVYDGTALTKDEAAAVGLLTGHTMSEVTVTGSQISVGSSANVASAAKILDENEVDVTANYDITYVDGTLTVTKAPSSGGGGGTITVPEEEIPAGLTTDHIAYIQGYPDDMVRPEGNVTREEVAAVFFRLLDSDYKETIRASMSNFNDVGASRWSTKHIGTLVNGKIINGYLDGTFKPGNYITRAELATIAARFDDLIPSTGSMFTDINNHWAKEYINSSSVKGWVNGYPDGTFKPDQYITRAEFVTLVNNVLQRRVHEEHILPEAKQFPDLVSGKWYYEAMQEAINSHLYERLEDNFEKWTEIYEPIIEM